MMARSLSSKIAFVIGITWVSSSGRGRPLAVQEDPAPPLETQQRPDQKPPVLLTREVLLEQPHHSVTLQVIVNTRLLVTEQSANVIDAVAFEPRRIRRRETLLDTVDIVLRDIPRQRLAQNDLAVVGLLEVLLGFHPGRVLVQSNDFGEVPQLVTDRDFHCEVDEIVIQEWHTGLESVRHAQLVRS